MINWSDIDYLIDGDFKQRLCYNAITRSAIMDILKEYNPTLVGTIPLKIAVDNSDIDIICCVHDFNQFQKLIRSAFVDFDRFQDNINIEDAFYTANFYFDGFEFEIYAESRQVQEQNGYRHMVIEYRILELADDYFQSKILELKHEGYKTEPAFGRLLGLDEPYSELLYMENLCDRQLSDLMKEKGVLT